MAEVHRVNANFSESAWRDLCALAEREGRTQAEILRRAIALERWFQDAIDSGARILVERSDGSIREVVPR